MWRCFHCDEVFHNYAEAEEHFGARLPEGECRVDDFPQPRCIAPMCHTTLAFCDNSVSHSVFTTIARRIV